MGGYVPARGTIVKDRKLVLNEDEAAAVRGIFERFVRARLQRPCLPRELAPAKGSRNEAGHLGRQGISLQGAGEPRLSRRRPSTRARPIQASIQAIIVRAALGSGPCHLAAEPAKARQQHPRRKRLPLLKGLIFTANGGGRHDPAEQHEEGRAAIPVLRLDGRHAKNRETQRDEGIARAAFLPTSWKRPVVTELRRGDARALRSRAQVIAHFGARGSHAFAEADVISALQTFDDVWGQLFLRRSRPGSCKLLVRRVTVTSEGAGDRCPD